MDGHTWNQGKKIPLDKAWVRMGYGNQGGITGMNIDRIDSQSAVEQQGQ
jgi:hypothetical protein